MSSALGRTLSGNPWAAWWEDDYQVPTIDPAKFMNFRDELEKVGPTILWIAESMASHHTGMRPEGSSVKLHGAWWKIEPWSATRIERHLVSRNAFSFMASNGWMTSAVMPTSNPRPFSYVQFAEDVRKALIKAIDDAFRSGMTREQIILLTDCRSVVQVMED